MVGGDLEGAEVFASEVGVDTPVLLPADNGVARVPSVELGDLDVRLVVTVGYVVDRGDRPEVVGLVGRGRWWCG